MDLAVVGRSADRTLSALARNWTDRTTALRLSSPVWASRSAFVVLAYLLATWITDAVFMADTLPYADTIVASKLGEFGHLLWYCWGWALSQVSMPVSRLVAGSDARMNVLIVLVTLNWLAGLLGALMLDAIVRKVCHGAWVGGAATVGLIFSYAFLNFSQSGSSYVPGLSLVLCGMYLSLTAAERADSFWRAWFAGVVLACAIGLWFPYVLAIPAALAFPLLVIGWDKDRQRLVLRTAMAFALTALLIYGFGALLQGIHTPAGLKDWFVSSAHGSNTSGLSRMIFGFSGSFTYTGNDGMIFKRFILHDPLNPVSLPDVLRLWGTLSKLLLFYLLLGSIALMLLRSEQGKPVLGFLAVNSVPVLVFAVSWKGGDAERYLPLYPAFFLSLAYCLSRDRSRLFKILVTAFMTTAVVTNVRAMSASSLAERQKALASRIEDLTPRLTRASLVATVNFQDELFQFNSSFPFHPINRAGVLKVYSLVETGTMQIFHWRHAFASHALSVWAAGGDVWISKRALAPRPRPEWYWVQDDGRQVPWSDIYDLFVHLDVGQEVGGRDGFVLLLSSPANAASLNRLLEDDETRPSIERH